MDNLSAGLALHLNLKWLKIPLKFTAVGCSSVPAIVTVDISAQFVLPVTAFSNVACTVTVPAYPLWYIAAVCNASLPLMAGSASIDSLYHTLSSTPDSPVSSTKALTEYVARGPGKA